MRRAHIVMLGSSPEGAGGIGTVLRIYGEAGLHRLWPVRLLPTWEPGSLLRRVWVACRSWLQLMAGLARREVQAVHAHAAAYGSFWRKALHLWPARWAGARTLLHVHDGRFIDWFSGLPGWQKALVVAVLNRVDRVIALTPGWARRLAQIAPQAHIVVLPNPVGRAPAARPVEGVVLFLGRLHASKGLLDLLEATAQCVATVPHLHLVCAGEGDPQPFLAHARRLGVAQHVRWPGALGKRALRRQLHRAQLLVLPSHAEGMPMSILEAMAAGVPVVASDAGGIPELLAHGGGVVHRRGDVPSLAQALQTLLTQPVHCADLGRQGQAVARRIHSPELVLRRLSRIYRSLALQPLTPCQGRTRAGG